VCFGLKRPKSKDVRSKELLYVDPKRCVDRGAFERGPLCRSEAVRRKEVPSNARRLCSFKRGAVHKSKEVRWTEMSGESVERSPFKRCAVRMRSNELAAFELDGERRCGGTFERCKVRRAKRDDGDKRSGRKRPRRSSTRTPYTNMHVLHDEGCARCII